MGESEDWTNVSLPRELHDAIVEETRPGQSKWGFIQEMYEVYQAHGDSQ